MTGKCLMKVHVNPFPIDISQVIHNERMNPVRRLLFFFSFIKESKELFLIKKTSVKQNRTIGDKLTSFSQNSYLLPMIQNRILSAGTGRNNSIGKRTFHEKSCVINASGKQMK
jgi:hypothetical protein